MKPSLLIAALAAYGTLGGETRDCCNASAAGLDPLHYIENASPPPADVVTGTARGQVRFHGERPQLEPLEIPEQKAEGCVPEGGRVSRENRSYRIDAEGGLADVVITIEVPDSRVKVPSEPIVMDQKSCRFEPYLIAVPVGVTVAFLNSDEVAHNVHTYPIKNEAINVTMGPHTKELWKLPRTDRVEIKCDLHPWMNSFILVTDTPYMAVTPADGAFAIPDLPVGTYAAEAWHPKCNTVKFTFTIGLDGSSEPLDIEMTSKKKTLRRSR